MRQVRKQTSGFPRVGCLVPNCHRGTTRITPEAQASGFEYVCPAHWATVPKSMRRRLAKALSIAKRCSAKQDPRAERWWAVYHARWREIRSGLVGDASTADIPMQMRAELESTGLL